MINTTKRAFPWARTAFFAHLTLCLAACTGPVAPQTPQLTPTSDEEPCLTPTTLPTNPAGQDTRFAANSPFDKNYKPPAAARGPKRLWANSYLWEEPPKLEVEQWLSAQPATAGKFVLVEFWATWCPPCRRSIALLNDLHRKFGKDLIVIGISHESEADVRAIEKKYGLKIEYFNAIDTKARTKTEMGVYGIPHVIMIEPGGCVVWEGFPLLKGHELTETIVKKMIDIGRKSGSLK